MPSRWPPNPKQNRILAALPSPDFERLADDLEPIELSLGQVLHESGDTLTHVYFPLDCIVSFVYTTENGSSAELAMTGCDGMVGFPLLLGGETTPHRAVVQSAGWACQLRAEVARWEFNQAGKLQHLALRYTQALMTQMAQSVVCNRHLPRVNYLGRSTSIILAGGSEAWAVQPFGFGVEGLRCSEGASPF